MTFTKKEHLNNMHCVISTDFRGKPLHQATERRLTPSLPQPVQFLVLSQKQ